MTFAPGGESSVGMPRQIRAVLFWLLMILLAMVLWKMASSSGNNGAPEEKLDYTQFMQQMDQKNIATAKIYAMQTTAVIHGTLREPPERFTVTIAKEQIPSVSEQLRNQNASVQVVAGATWTSSLLNVLPLLVLLAAWIFLFRRPMRRPPPSTPMGEPQNRPIG